MVGPLVFAAIVAIVGLAAWDRARQGRLSRERRQDELRRIFELLSTATYVDTALRTTHSFNAPLMRLTRTVAGEDGVAIVFQVARHKMGYAALQSAPERADYWRPVEESLEVWIKGVVRTLERFVVEFPESVLSSGAPTGRPWPLAAHATESEISASFEKRRRDTEAAARRNAQKS